MAEFIIPKGKEYTFTIKVMERDSFIAQTLTSVGEVTVEFLLTSTSTSVFDTTMTVVDGVAAVEAVDAVEAVAAVDAIAGVLAVNAVDAIAGVLAVNAVNAVAAIAAVDGVGGVEAVDAVEAVNAVAAVEAVDAVEAVAAVDAIVAVEAVEAVDGVNAVAAVLQCTLTAAETALLTAERGDKVDGYYLKPTHQALITIPFTDGTPTIFTILDEVFVAPTSTITE